MKSAHILIIEDSKQEIDYIVYTLKKNKIKNQITVIYDGDDAIQYAQNKHQSPPDIIFLDLNLPRIHGIEILKAFKNNQILSNIPIVILTSVITPEKEKEVLDLGAESLIQKPINFEKLVLTLNSIEHIALSIVSTKLD